MGSQSFEAEREQFLNQVAHDPKVKAAALRVAIIIASYVNERDGFAYPSFDRMAQDFVISRSAIMRGVAMLEERGHLIVRRFQGRDSNEYEWRFSGWKKVSEKLRTKNRSGPISATTSNGPISASAKSRAVAENRRGSGGRFSKLVAAENGRSGPIRAALTSEHQKGTSDPETGHPARSPVSRSERSDSTIQVDGDNQGPSASPPTPTGLKPAGPEDLDKEFRQIFGTGWLWKDDESAARSAYRDTRQHHSFRAVVDFYNSDAGRPLRSMGKFVQLLGELERRAPA